MKLSEMNKKIRDSKIAEDRKVLLSELAWLLVNKSKIEDVIYNREDEVPADVIEILKANVNQIRIDALHQELSMKELEVLH